MTATWGEATSLNWASNHVGGMKSELINCRNLKNLIKRFVRRLCIIPHSTVAHGRKYTTLHCYNIVYLQRGSSNSCIGRRTLLSFAPFIPAVHPTANAYARDEWGKDPHSLCRVETNGKLREKSLSRWKNSLTRREDLLERRNTHSTLMNEQIHQSICSRTAVLFSPTRTISSNCSAKF